MYSDICLVSMYGLCFFLLSDSDRFFAFCIQHAYNPDEEYAGVESQLRAHLESFLETARSFNMIYTKVWHALPLINILLFYFILPTNKE